MKYFENLQNEELKEFFLKDLNTLNEIVDFVYPNNLYDDYSIIDEHIIRCQNILHNYIVSELTDSDEYLSGKEKDSMAAEKAREIFKICEPDIQALFENANITTVYLGKK